MVGKERNFGLDVMRSASIMLVLLAHKASIPFAGGVLGVQMFFVLSGFLIGQILLRQFAEGSGSSTVFEFWKRRWFRTLPLYYLVLVFKILVFGNPYGWKIIVYFLFLQANFVGIDFFVVSWSLVVEEWFYIFLPVATAVVFRKGFTPAKFMGFLMSLILFFFCARYFWNYYQKGVIVYQFDCMLLGVLLGLLRTRYQEIYQRMKSGAIFFAGLAGVVFMMIVHTQAAPIPLYSPAFKVTWYFVISIFIALMVPYLEASYTVNSRLKGVKPLYFAITWTSILTYGMYLLHSDIYSLELVDSPVINASLQIALLYAVCYVLFVLYERPMMNLRDSFTISRFIQTMRTLSYK